MPPRWISATKVSNIVKLKELGYPVTKIAKLTGVSKMTVYDYTKPGFYEERLKRVRDYNRRAVIVTGTSKENIVKITGLNKRPHPGRCEVCGVGDKRLDYHHWDPDNPSIGMWICFKCHRLAELLDSLGFSGVMGLVSRYVQVKALIIQELVSNKQQSEQPLWDTELAE